MRHFVRRRSMVGIATLSVAALALAGCAAADDSGETSTSSGSSDSGSTSAAGCEAYADYLGAEGSTVEVYTSITSPELDLFVESSAEFEECTGIDIEWNGTKEFEAQLPVRAEGGTAPELAIFPQPGLLQRLAATGTMVPAPDAVSAAADANYTPDWKAYGTVDGTFYAAPLGANVKSFVWYSPKVFAENGWDIPTTWEDMLALSDEIAASTDIYPWCIGIESGEATGWVLTDWMEDLMLRFNDAETYDAWVDHTIPFNDPKVLTTIQEAAKIVKNPDYIEDIPSMATTRFQDGPAGLVDGTCAMHRQASFIGVELETNLGGTVVGPEATDVDGGVSVFYFPGVTADQRPALGGGEFVGAFSDDAATQAVQLYLTSAEWNNKKAALGGWFSPHLGLDIANVESPVNKVAVDILQNATTFRFDASDLMPAAVGADSFWKQMTEWVASDKGDQAVLDAIEASWPAE